MTEDQAKTKWCPMVRTGMVAGMAVNHHVDMQPHGDGVYNQTRCIASACMLWRWLQSPPANKTSKEVNPIWQGYCGLAGHTNA